MIKLIENNLDSIIRLFDSHHVLSASVFGSATTSDFNEKSDIDFLVTFKDSIDLMEYSDNYFNLKMKLEDLLNRQVDLVSSKSLRNPILIQNIDQSKVNLYAA